MDDPIDAEDVALTVVPITTATLSLIGSSLIIVTICRSKKKLKDAYRRIIFGMSVFDIFSSLAVVLKVFKSTPESNMWLHQGNQMSCNILGFFHLIGIVGTPMYSVNINIYYYYLVKQNMREEVFKKKIEPWLHGIPIIWSIAGGIYVWAAKMINPGAVGSCMIATYPRDCRKNEDVECIRGDHGPLLLILYIGCPVALCLIISIALLVAIWRTIRSQEIRMDRYRIRRVSLRLRESINADLGEGNLLSNPLARLRNRWRRRTKRTAVRSRAFLHSAVWYAAVFFATFTIPYIVNIMNAAGMKSPFGLRLTGRVIQPLQGLFNILVYTRPHVRTCRERNPELTWFKAFCRVVASGGDDDQSSAERRRRSSRMGRRSFSGSCSTSSLRRSGGYRSQRGSMRDNSDGGSVFIGPIRRERGENDVIADINEVMIEMNEIDLSQDLSDAVSAEDRGSKTPNSSAATEEGVFNANIGEHETPTRRRRKSVTFGASDVINEDEIGGGDPHQTDGTKAEELQPTLSA